MIWNLLLAPFKALAQPVQQINPDPCVVSGLSCGDPFAIVADLLTGNLLISVFGVVLFVMIIVYGVTLIVNSRNENAQEEAVSSYVNAFIGTVLAASASYIAGLVISGGANRNPDVINTGTFLGVATDVLAEVYNFIKVIVIGLLILNLTIQAFRIITSVDDSSAGEARKALVRSILGSIIVLIAVPVINSIVPGGPPTGVIAQFVLISTYLVVVLGGIAAIGLVIAGIMYIVSIDESLKDRANKLIIVCLVTLVVAAVAYALLNSI